MVTGSPAPAARPPDSNRRSNKPIMEKRRRARINHCLNELKSLILDSMNKDPARHTKLEKADILEMTVKHVETLQRSQAALSVAADPGVLNKFKAGWGQCVGEIGRFPGIDTQVKKRLMEHLSTCIDRTSELSSIVTLVPTRLVNGDIALVVPCSPHREQHQQAHHGSPPPAPQAPCQQPSYPSSPPDLRAQASRSPVLASHPMSSQSPPVLYPVSSGSPTQEPALNPQPLDHRAQQPLSLVVKQDDKPWRPW